MSATELTPQGFMSIEEIRTLLQHTPGEVLHNYYRFLLNAVRPIDHTPSDAQKLQLQEIFLGIPGDEYKTTRQTLEQQHGLIAGLSSNERRAVFNYVWTALDMLT